MTPYRRIGLIGDIHAEDQRLERALSVLEARGVELIAATGDIGDGPGSLDRCCQLLESHRVLAVRGNHDRWLLAGTARDLPHATPPEDVADATRTMLAGLPLTAEIDTVAGRALLCHGVGSNDMARVMPGDLEYAIAANTDLQDLVRGGDYRWILNGHSHRRLIRHFAGLTLINAGTLLRHHDPCFLELDFAAGAGLAYGFDPDGEVAPAPERLSLFQR